MATHVDSLVKIPAVVFLGVLSVKIWQGWRFPSSEILSLLPTTQLHDDTHTMDVLRSLTKDSGIANISNAASDAQARADAAFSTRMCVEARMLAERDAKTGTNRGWAWQTRVAYEKGNHHPYANYCGYLRNQNSGFWPVEDTTALEKMPWQKTKK